MVPGKGKKRALSYDAEEIVTRASTTRPGKGGSGKNNNGDDDWSTWQEGVRTQEADRVQQYTKTFQRDIVQKAHDSALASLRRQENTHMQREQRLHQRILEECKWERAGGERQDPLYVAGRQVLDLLESTLDQYHRAEAALTAMGGSGRDDEYSSESLRSSWDNDLAEARKLLSYGRAYGDGLVRDIIVPASPGSASKITSPALVKDDSSINQTGKAALSMFPRSSTAAASQDTWGEAAHSQMEMLSRLMKTVLGGHSGSVLAPEKKTVRFDL